MNTTPHSPERRKGGLSNENVRTAAETPRIHLQKIDSFHLQFTRTRETRRKRPRPVSGSTVENIGKPRRRIPATVRPCRKRPAPVASRPALVRKRQAVRHHRTPEANAATIERAAGTPRRRSTVRRLSVYPATVRPCRKCAAGFRRTSERRAAVRPCAACQSIRQAVATVPEVCRRIPANIERAAPPEASATIERRAGFATIERGNRWPEVRRACQRATVRPCAACQRFGSSGNRPRRRIPANIERGQAVRL